jgi:hypothetical protein
VIPLAETSVGRYSPAVPSREERVGRNEAAAREINERIEDAHAGAPPDRYLRVVCECGRDDCERVIAITIPEYESVRRESALFAVARDHMIADLERVVDQTDRFVVVAKREGAAQQVASEEDPRR